MQRDPLIISWWGIAIEVEEIRRVALLSRLPTHRSADSTSSGTTGAATITVVVAILLSLTITFLTLDPPFVILVGWQMELLFKTPNPLKNFLEVIGKDTHRAWQVGVDFPQQVKQILHAIGL